MCAKKARIARIRAYRNYYCHAVLMALVRLVGASVVPVALGKLHMAIHFLATPWYPTRLELSAHP
jgi:hypothetical protein